MNYFTLKIVAAGCDLQVKTLSNWFDRLDALNDWPQIGGRRLFKITDVMRFVVTWRLHQCGVPVSTAFSIADSNVSALCGPLEAKPVGEYTINDVRARFVDTALEVTHIRLDNKSDSAASFAYQHVRRKLNDIDIGQERACLIIVNLQALFDDVVKRILTSLEPNGR